MTQRPGLGIALILFMSACFATSAGLTWACAPKLAFQAS